MISIYDLKEHCERQLEKLPKVSKMYEEHLLTLAIIETNKKYIDEIDNLNKQIDLILKEQIEDGYLVNFNNLDEARKYYKNLVKKENSMSEIEIKKLDLKLKEGHAVCFDFDGVIHKYSKGWQDGSIYDEYNKNVLDLMLFLQKSGIPIFICSTREPMQIINWWNKQGFWCEAVRINGNETFWKDTNFIGVTNKKLPAQMYIDDRAYKYTGQTVKQFILDNSEEIH